MTRGLYSLFVAAILAVSAEAQQPPYNCDLNAAQQPSQNCGEVITYGFNDAQIREVLNAFDSHYGGQVKWSPELALQAQAWTNQCSDQQNPCFKSPGGQLNSNSQSSYKEPVNLASMISSSLNGLKNMPNPSANFPSSYNFPGYPTYPNSPNFNDWPQQNNFPNVLPNDPYNYDYGYINPFYRYKRQVADYSNSVGCGFISYKKNDEFNHHLLCYYGSLGKRNDGPGY
ncbi:venom allergen 5.02-like [Venturia canescens]|uniref:venom allergen 5.02-like n=1 Tax=Venturia canescens TaxID=32260 RepID=UPI001C9CF3BC|nr:venom allergen 5.02-like [Venturia canescens]